MGNTRLSQALGHARMSVDELAERIKVSPKSVRRWVNDGDLPYEQNRVAVSRVLGEDPRWLWPDTDAGREIGATSDAEVLASYAHRSLVPFDAWRALIEQARSEVDLLGFAMQHLPEQHPELVPALQALSAASGKIRIALADPDDEEAARRDAEEQLHGGLEMRIRTARHYFAQGLDGLAGVSMHWHNTPMYCSIFRFDDEMFVTPHLYGRPGWEAPLLHLRRLGPSGIFQVYADHFEAVWATSRPMDT